MVWGLSPPIHPGLPTRSEPFQSELLAQEPRDRIEHLPQDRPVLEIRSRHPSGDLLIALENGDLLRRKDGVVDVQVGLVVQPEGPIVEIRRAD